MQRGRPKRIWLDRVRDDIREKALSVEEVYDRATWMHHTPTPHQSGNKMKKKIQDLTGLPYKQTLGRQR